MCLVWLRINNIHHMYSLKILRWQYLVLQVGYFYTYFCFSLLTTCIFLIFLIIHVVGSEDRGGITMMLWYHKFIILTNKADVK